MGDRATADHVVSAAIARAGWRFVRGERRGPDRPGYCLKLVRMVIEDAFEWPGHEFYRRVVGDTWVQPEGYPLSNGHWARDAERAMRELGWWVEPAEAQPGDLLCNHEAAWSDRWGAYIGHIAVVLDHGLLLENVNPAYRPEGVKRGALCLTRLGSWDATSAFRFPKDFDIRA